MNLNDLKSRKLEVYRATKGKNGKSRLLILAPKPEDIDFTIIKDQNKLKEFQDLVIKAEEIANQLTEGEIKMYSDPKVSSEMVTRFWDLLSENFKNFLIVTSQLIEFREANKELLDDSDKFYISFLEKCADIEKDGFNIVSEDLKSFVAEYQSVGIPDVYTENNRHKIRMISGKKDDQENSDSREKLVEFLKASFPKDLNDDDVFDRNGKITEKGINVLQCLFRICYLSDFIGFVKIGNLADEIIEAIKYNALLDSGYSVDEINKMDENKRVEILDKPEARDALSINMATAVADYIDYIDPEKLITFIVNDHLAILKRYEGQKELLENSKDSTNVLLFKLYNPLVSRMLSALKSDKLRPNIRISKYKSHASVEFESVKALRGLTKDLVDGLYMPEWLSDIFPTTDIKHELEFTDAQIRRMKFTDDEICKYCCENSENVERFFRLGFLGKKEIGYSDIPYKILFQNEQNVIECIKSQSSGTLLEQVQKRARETFRKLYGLGLFKNEKLFKYFFLETKMLEVEDLKTAKEMDAPNGNFNKELREFIIANSESFFKDVLIASKSDSRKESTQIYVDNFITLVRDVYLAEMPEKERNEFVEDFLLEFIKFQEEKSLDEKDSTEVAQTLYFSDMLSLKEIATMDLDNELGLAGNVLYNVLISGDPEKIKRIKEEDLKDISNNLAKILEAKEISSGEKAQIIMILYSDDPELADTYLSNVQGNSYGENSSTGKKPEKDKDKITAEGDPNLKAKRYVYNKSAKWKILSSLDPNSKITVYDNGYMTVELPRLQKVIFEKLSGPVNRKFTFDEEPYGVATYVTSEEIFKENFNNFVVEQKSSKETKRNLDMRAVRRKVGKKGQIIHSTQSENKNWARGILNRLGISIEKGRLNNSQYTDKELSEIERIIEENEKNIIEI